nr:MAG TPA: hypothetical protein [Crassvirales sp.]
MESQLCGSQSINYKKKSMKKLIFVETGKEVEIGKKVAFGMNSAYGFIPFYTVTICEESIPLLIEEGVIKEVEEEGTHVDPYFYIEHLAKRIHWNKDNLQKYLANLYTIYPAAVLSIMLREIAIVMDEKYKNHIENSKEIYVISTLSGEITKVKNLDRIKNFKNFAAFRTLDDALAAKHILRDPMKQMFKRGGKQKD